MRLARHEILAFVSMVICEKIFGKLNTENIKGNRETNVLAIYTLLVIV